MARIYKAGGGGRKRRGFKGSKIPESQALLQHTKQTLQGMQTVKDNLQNQRREELQTLRSGQRQTERQANVNTRQAEENDRVLRNALLKQYKTEVLSDQAKSARISYDEQQRKQLMSLIKQVPDTITQIDQLRLTSAAKWVNRKKALATLGEDNLHLWFGDISKLRNRDSALKQFIKDRNLTGTQAETLRQLSGYRAILVQENMLRERMKDPNYIINNEANYDKKLETGDSEAWKKIQAARNNKSLGGGKFTPEDAKTLRAHKRAAREHMWEQLQGKYTDNFINHHARQIIDENYAFDLQSIYALEQENAEIRTQILDTDEFSSMMGASENTARKPKTLDINPKTGKPYVSFLDQYIKHGNDIAGNTKVIDYNMNIGTQTGVIYVGKNRVPMKMGATEVDNLANSLIEVDGQVMKFRDKFPTKVQNWEKNAARLQQHNDGVRESRIRQQSNQLATAIMDGTITTPKEAHAYIEKAAAYNGGMSQDERYKHFGDSLGLLNKEKLAPNIGQNLWNGSVAGMSPHRAKILGIPMTPKMEREARELSVIAASDMKGKLDAFFIKVKNWGNNQTSINGKNYSPSISSILKTEQVKKQVYSEIREVLGAEGSTLGGIEAAATVLTRWETKLTAAEKSNEGIFQLAVDDEGKVIKHDGRKYVNTSHTQLEDSEFLGKLSVNKSIIFSKNSMPTRFVNELARHLKYGDAEPTLLSVIAEKYPQKSKFEIAATVIQNNAPDSGLVDKDGYMMVPGYIGLVQAAKPSDEEKRMLNDGTPSGTLAMGIMNKNLAGAWNLSKDQTSVLLSEAYINPTVGAMYETSDERWNALETEDGIHQANESVLGKSLYDTTVGEMLQMDYFKLPSGTGSEDLVRSLTEGSISLDNTLSPEVQSKIWTDKVAYDSGKFQLTDMAEAIPVGQAKFPSRDTSWAFEQRPSLQRDIRMEWDKDVETIKQTVKTLSKGAQTLGKLSQTLRDPFNITTPGGLKDKYKAMNERAQTQYKQFLKDVESNKALSNKRKRELKKAWEYLITPDNQLYMDSISDTFKNEYNMDFNSFDPDFRYDLVNKL